MRLVVVLPWLPSAYHASFFVAGDRYALLSSFIGQASGSIVVRWCLIRIWMVFLKLEEETRLPLLKASLVIPMHGPSSSPPHPRTRKSGLHNLASPALVAHDRRLTIGLARDDVTARAPIATKVQRHSRNPPSLASPSSPGRDAITSPSSPKSERRHPQIHTS